MAAGVAFTLDVDGENWCCDALNEEPAMPNSAVTRTVCVLCHGMNGTKEDWRTWVDCLQSRRPDWVLLACESLTRHAVPIVGKGVDALAVFVAEEIVEVCRRELASSGQQSLTLHCIGHSMGGVILRGALPKVFHDCPQITAGIYCSLSCPHLGVRAAWGAPETMWRNLSFIAGILSPQCPQLAVQDGKLTDALPYLVELADPEGPYLRALGQFRRRICVTMARKDIVIPATSGALWADRPWARRPPPPSRTLCSTLAFARQASGSDLEADSQDERTPRSTSSDVAAWTTGWGYEAFSSHRPGFADQGTPVDRPAQCERCRLQAANGIDAGDASSTSRDCSSDSSDVYRQPPSPCVARSGVEWLQSSDKTCWYPRQALDGLLSLSWERLVLRLWLPQATAHVFTLAKRKEQSELEHFFSAECVVQLIELLVLAASGHDMHVDAPRWVRSAEARATVGSLCEGAWVVATEEGVNNVKFYPFRCEAEAAGYFDSLAATSRVLFEPAGEERRRAGANVASWSTIRKAHARAVKGRRPSLSPQRT